MFKIFDPEQGVVVIDNRNFNISGLSGNNQNFNFGDHGNIQQKVNGLSEIEMERLFKDLHRFALDNSDERDLKSIESIKENAKKGQMNTAKTLFDLLTKTVQASSAGVAIAKAFGWV
ncbi:hypothetical protein [Fontibacillus sp. BL9]|uniref:hypothetical protein n=1 Tax=Fontibacillus sp. BL9 TaxID=3389971 RepID=UPI00397B11F0